MRLVLISPARYITGNICQFNIESSSRVTLALPMTINHATLSHALYSLEVSSSLVKSCPVRLSRGAVGCADGGFRDIV